MGFSQITNNLPLRRTTLHLAQRLRIDGETFIATNSFILAFALDNQRLDYTRAVSFRPVKCWSELIPTYRQV
ncbi:MAG: hypothetical protein A3K45_05725 [Chloroflexi bacterium RIFOXYC12_FULL_59_14]|nr:MAG: hypothetical protein A3K41_11750 [Chloroflexi bacterium RIFOXYD12_FULL_57_15]OGO75327.1 MAG: hypothetical protein A3K45_05725 [Chloroflexi bacterium RIFOXYC12_FULL_59_14]